MPRSFWYMPVRAGSMRWPSRQLFRAAKWLWPHGLLHRCFQSAGAAGGRCAAALERRVCLKDRKVPPGSVHVPIWLQKAGESAPDCLHADRTRPPCAVPSPTLWKHQRSLSLPMLKSPELQQLVTTVRLLWQPYCIIISSACWFTGERVDFAKLRHHLLA